MRLLALVLLAALPLLAAAADPALAYRGELIERARSTGLATDPSWLRLGHWRPRLLGGVESEADGPAFFLSPRGKRDPSAELEATLAGLFDPVPADPDAHPQCRFPARFALLTNRLGIDLTRLPPRRCEKLAHFWERTQARSVSMVFSSYYLGGPSSAFGHTFLRLNKAEAAETGERAELLDQGVNYAATSDSGNALLYAFKGLTGLFKGEFTALPYFYKVREYADYESRDLWEYQLALTPPEVALLVAHLWELGGTWFDYYYLTENCSYHVLGALEAASPRLELISRIGRITLPADTVKALYTNPGLVLAARFRPSVRTQFARRAAALSPRAQALLMTLAEAPGAPLPEGLPDTERAAALDATVDLFDMRHAHALVEGDAEVAAERQRLLARRSAVPVVSAPLVVPPPALGGPEVGHPSTRQGLGFGVSSDGGPYLSLRYRLALHDLLDPASGFATGSQIEFLDTRLRWIPRHQQLQLDDFSLVDVASVNPLDRFDQHISWHMRAGLTTVRDGGCRSCLAGVVELGGGPALELGGALTALFSADSELLASPALRGAGGSSFRPGVGPTASLLFASGERFAMKASAGARYLPFASPDFGYALAWTGRLHLGPVSLSLEWRKLPLAYEGELSALLFW